MESNFLFGVALFFLSGLMASSRERIAVSTPFHQFTQTLIASADLNEKPYVMVPISLSTGADDMLLGFKRGEAHAHDDESIFELRAYRPSSGHLLERRAVLGEPGLSYYNGEFIQFPNGNVSCLVDVQQGGPGTGAVTRLGLREARSRDGGRTFSAPRRLGPLGGVEYGYAFSAATRGGRTYLLAMRFANLAGGKAVDPARPHAGSVDVVVSDDSGATWRLLRDLTAEFGRIPINESALLPCADGWLVTCRGYDNRHWLFRTDADFRTLARRELTADFDCVNAYIGRPRLYARDGRTYMLGRNWTRPAGAEKGAVPMQLCWFRLRLETLALETCVVLDNAAAQAVADGYYATAHWTERDGRTLMNVITYKAAAFHPPDLLRLEFLWDEIK